MRHKAVLAVWMTGAFLAFQTGNVWAQNYAMPGAAAAPVMPRIAMPATVAMPAAVAMPTAVSMPAPLTMPASLPTLPHAPAPTVVPHPAVVISSAPAVPLSVPQMPSAAPVTISSASPALVFTPTAPEPPEVRLSPVAVPSHRDQDLPETHAATTPDASPVYEPQTSGSEESEPPSTPPLAAPVPPPPLVASQPAPITKSSEDWTWKHWLFIAAGMVILFVFLDRKKQSKRYR